MLFIEELDAPTVIKHISGFFKADMVLSEIPGGLAVAPCEAVRYTGTIYTLIHTIATVEDRIRQHSSVSDSLTLGRFPEFEAPPIRRSPRCAPACSSIQRP